MDLGGGKVVSNPRELTTLLDSTLAGNNVAIHGFDVVYPSPSHEEGANPLTAILYGSVGTASFWDLHQILAARASKAVPPGNPLERS